LLKCFKADFRLLPLIPIIIFLTVHYIEQTSSCNNWIRCSYAHSHTVPETWDGIINGISGISPIDSFDISSFASTFGGVIRNFDIAQYISDKDAKRMDGFIHYGIAAGCQAIEDSGLEVTDANAERIGVAIGSGIGGITGIEECYATYEKGGPRRISPFFVPGNIINMISGQSFNQIRFKGAKLCHRYSLCYRHT